MQNAMFNSQTVGLIVLLFLGLVARSNLVSAAAAILLALGFVRVPLLYRVLEQRGVELGLLFLTMAMLVPFAVGRITLWQAGASFFTLPGIMALIGGAIATHLNGRGLEMLDHNSQLMVSLIIGSILGIVLWGGIPVGPLMAGGVTYLLLQIAAWVTRFWK